jgi:hypothetical protein
MNRGKPFRGLHAIESIIAVILIGVGKSPTSAKLCHFVSSLTSLANLGIFILGVGTYASVQSIINSYANGSIKSPFSCGDNGF